MDPDQPIFASMTGPRSSLRTWSDSGKRFQTTLDLTRQQLLLIVERFSTLAYAIIIPRSLPRDLRSFRVGGNPAQAAPG